MEVLNRMNTTSKMKRFLILSVMVTLLSGCLQLLTNPDFDDNGSPWTDMTMYDWLKSPHNTSFTDYIKAAELCGFDEVIRSESGYTFILPNNAALNTFARIQRVKSIDQVHVDTLKAMFYSITCDEMVLSSDMKDKETRMMTTLSGVPMGIYMTSSSIPFHLQINKNLPKQERSYEVVSTAVTVQDLDFKDHVGHGVGIIPSWKFTDVADAPEQEDPPVPADRLLKPELDVVEYSLMSREVAYVTWKDVADASGYIVKVDGNDVTYENNRIDFTGRYGKFEVSVTAISALSGIKDSDPVTVTVNLVKEFGSGTQEDPYRIYKAKDWTDLAEAVNSGTRYRETYFCLMNDIDFCGKRIQPVGVNNSNRFEGVFDGCGFTMKNAVIDDGVSADAGLFCRAYADIRNVTIQKFDIKSYGTGAISNAGGIVGGIFTGVINNCHVVDTKIRGVGNESGKQGNYTGGIASSITDAATRIENCSVSNSYIYAQTEYVAGIVGKLDKGSISNCISENNNISSPYRHAAGVAALVSGNGVVDACVAYRNHISSGDRYVGGIISLLTLGTMINCISDYNTLTLEVTAARSGGALVGFAKGNSAILNCVSRDNLIQTRSDKDAPYISLGAGTDGGSSGLKYVMANCFIESGIMMHTRPKVVYPMGIVIAFNNTDKLSHCYYDIDLQKNVDISEFSKIRYGCGRVGSVNDKDSEGTIPVDAETISKPTGEDALVTLLNNYVETNITTYPLLRKWVMKEGTPTLDL